MATKAEVQREIEWEASQRPRMGMLAIAAALLTLISTVISQVTLANAPTVGIVQGLAPALSGQANPPVSPRAPEVRYLSHHAAGLIAGSVVAALGLILFAFALRFLYDATKFRRPETLPAGRMLLFGGAIVVGLLSVSSQVIGAINTHNFATGHDFTNHAVDYALQNAPARVASAYLTLAAQFALLIGLIITSLNAMRAGLLTRFMGILGIIAAVLFVIPVGSAPLVVLIFWMGALGMLLLGRWPNGDPPAWIKGEAVPWPSNVELREQRQAARQAARAQAGEDVAPALVEEPAPEPTVRHSSSSGRHRRKRKGGARH